MIYMGANPKQANQSLVRLTRIFSLIEVIFTLNTVRTFTKISLNNPVYSQHAIMVIVQYIGKVQNMEPWSMAKSIKIWTGFIHALSWTRSMDPFFSTPKTIVV